MLEICLVLWKSEPNDAYKHYASKENIYLTYHLSYIFLIFALKYSFRYVLENSLLSEV